MMQGVSPRARRREGSLLWEEFGLDVEASNTAFTTPVFYFLGRLLLESVPDHVRLSYLYPSLFTFTTTAQTPLENALARGGFSFAPLDSETLSPFARTAAKYKTLLDNSLSTEETAEMLGTSVEEVMQRLANRMLYGVPSEDGLKVPQFQFEEGRVLPGFEEVLPLLDNDLHPVAVQNWFTNPNTDLLISDEAVSPREWLLSGRSTTDVARIAIDV
jgi:hypothetical protein